MHLSQSAMSTALADLEKAFQVQLLVRHHARGISLTPAGRELLAASRQLLAQAADLLGAAEGLGTSLTGTVQIGCFSVPAPYLLPELLATAAGQFPDLQVETTEVNLAELAEGVASGRFELGIGYDLIDDDRLTQDPLYRLPPYVLLPGTHRWARRRSVRLAELAEEPMVLLDLPHSRDYFQRIFSQRRRHPDRALPLGQRGDLPRAGRPRPGLHGAEPAAEGLGRARRAPGRGRPHPRRRPRAVGRADHRRQRPPDPPRPGDRPALPRPPRPVVR